MCRACNHRLGNLNQRAILATRLSQVDDTLFKEKHVITLAASPVTKESGMNPRRVVMRVKMVDDLPKEFVVHDQGWFEGRSYYANGYYFRVDGHSRTNAMEAFEKAFKKWQEKSATMTLGLSFDCIVFTGPPKAVPA